MPIDLVLRIRKIDYMYILKLSVLLEIHVIKKAKTRFLNSKSVVVLKQSQKTINRYKKAFAGIY